jgi:outer membrane immunogenic protein
VLTLGVFRATAEEMSTAPAYIITGPTNVLHWSGFYVGGNGGYAGGNSSVSYTAGDPASRQSIPSADFKTNGGLAGGQIGFNWQLTALWLAGIETDYQWSNSKGVASSNFRLAGVGTATMVSNESLTSFGTLRLRMGVTPASALLLYGTAGLAYGRVAENLTISSVAAGAPAAVGGVSYSCTGGNAACFAGSSSNVMWGWTAGAGAEYAITNNLTLKGEVLYINLGVPSSRATAIATLPATAASSFAAGFASASFIVARGGLNFKF